ncbi:MAG: nucleoside hydrolase [Armatimonadota bacterium]|nr:nucleoside hydrolase [Armatimonadota bacterium]MDR7402715.1 nucleoside hydrolase [Armatimonadota bacterium]MDR7403510.1 nucleoside hydrolase [Armatimonadota bacterium]MDR7506489.1 nucleoside hydrolase [Armatimonadota bacterium]MDR7509854.1 nucleoside hydrolase [Armatimonadota bacterium]
MIIDTDPGIDDAMAIVLALASPDVRVEGLSIVFGNTSAEQGARNALAVLETAGRPDIPVAIGARKPLVRPYHGRGAVVHGSDGLGETGLGNGRPVPNLRSIDFLISRIAQTPGEISIVALGPLTNLALAVSAEPRLAQWTREVVVMGGAVSTRGNATPVAEANIHNDPEAARIVFHAGWPVTLVGLDVTHQVVMTPEDLRRLAAAQTPVTRLITAITPFYMEGYRRRMGIDGFYVHDPTAMVALIAPALFDVAAVYVDVVTGDDRALGQTIADFRGQWNMAPNVRVCVRVDAAAVVNLYCDRVIRYQSQI